MRDIYLGDSYDLVKRFWCEALQPIAPLLAHPRFVPVEIRDRFSKLTTIPILDISRIPDTPFAIFLDPHTGIPLPSGSAHGATPAHASLPFIVEFIEKYHPSFLICFDQSVHRRHRLTSVEQRGSKRDYLRDLGISSFYYVSHAPFLFVAERNRTLFAIRKRLIDLGIPESRIWGAI